MSCMGPLYVDSSLTIYYATTKNHIVDVHITSYLFLKVYVLLEAREGKYGEANRHR